MDINRIEMLLKDVSHISREYEKMAKLSGENFNIFKTMGLQSAEVRLHSSILAEFLNPKGSHGQNDLFLDLFVKQFGIADFDTKSAEAKVEKYIGRINLDYTEGGRIDILLKDIAGNCIMIENKIYAGDQEKQLERYHNAYPKAKLFYLTLEGCDPSKFSTGDNDIKYYIPISYSKNIITWLEECKKEAVSLPIIRETITQYIHLLKYLTNQTTTEKMKDEIKKIIQKNLDYVDSIDKCAEVLQSLVRETSERLMQLLGEKYSNTVSLSNGLSIRVHWGNSPSDDGFFCGYKIDDDSTTREKIEEYQGLLRAKDKDLGFSGGYYIAWFYPKSFSGEVLENWNKKKMVEMNQDKDKLEQFIEELVSQEKEKRETIISVITK